MNGMPVRVERCDHMMIVTIDRPEARNAVNRDVHLGVGLALEQAEADRDVRVVVLTGAGDAFCAGADLKALGAGQPIVPDDPAQAAWGFGGYVAHAISKPTIAAVNGLALGGGLELVLASDLAVAADHAEFGLPEVTRGIIAGAGGAFRLARQMAPKLAFELLFTGARIDASRALELGLVNRVVPAAQVMGEALALAHAIARNAPLAVQSAKRVARGIVDGHVASEDAAWELNRVERQRTLDSLDAREGIRAFAEKRPPVWQAR